MADGLLEEDMILSAIFILLFDDEKKTLVVYLFILRTNKDDVFSKRRYLKLIKIKFRSNKYSD